LKAKGLTVVEADVLEFIKTVLEFKDGKSLADTQIS